MCQTRPLADIALRVPANVPALSDVIRFPHHGQDLERIDRLTGDVVQFDIVLVVR